MFNIVTKSLAWKKKQWPGAAALLKAINSDMGMYPNRLSLPTAVFVLGALFFYEKHVVFSVWRNL